MNSRSARALLLFLDGVGLGEDDRERNPFLGADLPCIRSLLGGAIPLRTTVADAGGVLQGPEGLLVAADACLGVPGLPQSGTGQTALLTGVNAPERFGRHFGSWVPTGLRPMLRSENLLSRLRDRDRVVAFANAYPGAENGTATVQRRPAAPPLAAHAAGALVRGATALREGRAIASSLTNERWRAHLGRAIPEVSAEVAGARLAGIAEDADFTFFAHYDTDLVGHRGDHTAAIAALEKVDRFLSGVLAERSPELLIVIASDHGNVEDSSAGHTTHPVPVLAIGPGREHFRAVRRLTDVAPILFSLLDRR